MINHKNWSAIAVIALSVAFGCCALTLGTQMQMINRLQAQVTQMGTIMVAHANQLKRQDTALTHTFPAEYSKKAWPGLTQEQVIALGESLKGRDINRVHLFCASTNCTAIRADVDDAMQIAGIDTEWEDRPVDIESEEGIFVGCMICQNGQPVPKDLEPIMAGLKAAGLKPIVTDTESGLGIFFGKKPK